MGSSYNISNHDLYCISGIFVPKIQISIHYGWGDDRNDEVPGEKEREIKRKIGFVRSQVKRNAHH